MGNQCTCLTSMPQYYSEDLSHSDPNIKKPIKKILQHKESNPKNIIPLKDPQLLPPLVSEKFLTFPKSKDDKSKLLPLKLHKYLLTLLTKKHFHKRKSIYELESKKIYDYCIKTIYHYNPILSKSELNNKISKYTKDGYKKFYSNSNDIINLSFEPPLTEVFNDVIVIEYSKEKSDIKHNDNNKNYNEQYIKNEISKYALSIYKGQVNIKNIPHGYGVKTHRQGIKQRGYWQSGEFSGWNEMIDDKGNILIGKFTKGIVNGKGEKYSINNNAVYIGDIVNNAKEGNGIEKSNEGIYKGEFKGDKKNGKGKFEYSTGDVYEGDFVDDLFEGNGKYKWKVSGYEYIGEYKQGVMHGSGVYKWNEGEYYKGSFVQGVKEGNGEMKWCNGRKYIGPFKKGKPHGIGMFDNGINFKGEIEFIEGKLNKNYLKQRMHTETTTTRENSQINKTDNEKS